MCEVPAKIVAPHLFFLSHFLLKRCCPSFIIQSSDFSCCFSCRKKHKLREAQNLVFLSRIPQATVLPLLPPGYCATVAQHCKWPQPVYHFNYQASSATGWFELSSLEAAKHQAAHIQEGARIKESLLLSQQTWLDQSQITTNSLLIRDPRLASAENNCSYQCM